MTSKDFSRLLERRLARTREVLAAKNREYAANADPLHNFNEAAAILRGTRQNVTLRGACERCGCQIEAEKHEVSGAHIDARTGKLRGGMVCPTSGCGTVIMLDECGGKIGAPAAPAVESRR